MEQIEKRIRHFAEGGAAFCLALLIFSLLYLNGATIMVSSCVAVGVCTVLCIISIIFQHTGLSVGCISAIIYLVIFISFSFDPLLSLDGERGEFVLRAEKEAQSYTSYGAVDCTLISHNGEKVKPTSVKLILLDASPEGISPGDRITVNGKLKLTSGGNRYSEGCFLNLSQIGEIEVEKGKSSTIFTHLAQFSANLSRKIRSVLRGDEGALLSALLCGDKSAFTPQYQASLRASGLSHIAAVSGMHLSILLAIILFLFPKKAAMAIAIPVMLCFAAMTGFSPSIVRALIMSSMLAVAFLLKAEYDALTALVTAGAVIGLLNPFALCSVSFLLSFFSTLGIILFSPRIMGFFSKRFPRNRILLKICHWLVSAVSVTLSATVFTLPLQMLFFPSVSLNFLLSNILAVWAVAPAMFIAIFLLPLAFFVPTLSEAAVFIIGLPLKYVNQIIYLMGDTLRFTSSSDNLWLILTAAVVIVGAVLLWFEKIKPSVFISSAATAVVLSTLFALLASTPEITIWGENGAVCISVHNKGDLLNVGAPANYNGAYFAENQLGKGRNQTVLLLNVNYSHSGGLDAGLADKVYSPAKISDADAKIYTQSGRLDFNGFSAETLLIESGVAAVRITTDKLSVLDMSCVDPYSSIPQLPKTDILVISSDFTKAPRITSALCATVSPSLVFVSGDTGASLKELEKLCSCKVTLLDGSGEIKIK